MPASIRYLNLDEGQQGQMRAATKKYLKAYKIQPRIDDDFQNHAFLNIAVGCGRLGVPPDMAELMIKALECRVHQFNDTDLRQWNEVSWRYPTLCTQHEYSKASSPKTGAKHPKACVSAASVIQNKGRRASP